MKRGLLLMMVLIGLFVVANAAFAEDVIEAPAAADGEGTSVEVDDADADDPAAPAAAAPAAKAPDARKLSDFVPCVIVVKIDGKPAEDGTVIIRDQVEKDTVMRLGIEKGRQRATLHRDHHYIVRYRSGNLKFEADKPVWLGKVVELAKIVITYNSQTKKWGFTWDKFGDTERCSLYFNIKRANDKPVHGYHLTLICEPDHVVLQDVPIGDDGKITWFLPKPDEGEEADKYFALLASNRGADLRYRFRVGPKSQRVRQEFVLRSRPRKPGIPDKPVTPPGVAPAPAPAPTGTGVVPTEGGM